MELVSASEMRAIDDYTIQHLGIPAVLLMENAGSVIAAEAIQLAAACGKRWAVLAGKGNNGADGVVAARHMQEAGLHVTVLYAEDPAACKGEAALQRDIARRFPLPVEVYRAGAIEGGRFDGLIDGLLGTGSRGAPHGVYAAMIEEANRSGLPVLAIDIPSGLDADTGQPAQPCVRAAVTVALAFAKLGLAQHPGAALAGRVVVRPIGIPRRLAKQHGVKTFSPGAAELTAALGLETFVRRGEDSHKGTYGHVLAAAGSRWMSGAGLLCVRAALRGGCGLVSWALPAQTAAALVGFAPEAMLRGLPDEGTGEWSAVAPDELIRLAEGKQAFVIGPGLGRFDGDTAWLQAIWRGTSAALVLDADALNMWADAGPGKGPDRGGPVVMTPHPAEMARLIGRTTAEVQRDRVGQARAFATTRGVTVVLKGARTVIASPDGTVFINRTGNPGMSTGGTGDVLAGLIGSLLAQGLTPLQAAAFGAHLHGLAGDRAAAERSEPSMLASDVIEKLWEDVR